jgi:hypothetical protein
MHRLQQAPAGRLRGGLEYPRVTARGLVGLARLEEQPNRWTGRQQTKLSCMGLNAVMDDTVATPPLQPLEPEAADAVGAAFDAAWNSLCASGERLTAQETCDARIRLDRVIVDLARSGERDFIRLRDRALASLDEPTDRASA